MKTCTRLTEPVQVITTDGSTTQACCVVPPSSVEMSNSNSILSSQIENNVFQAAKALMMLGNRYESTDNFIKMCERHLSPSILMIVKSHMSWKLNNPHGDRYSNNFKRLALTVYFLGPVIYRFLKKTFGLPTIRTLKRVTSTYELTPGLNDFLFDILKFKISNFNPEALDCILCADEMSLKSHLYYSIPKDEIIGFHQTNHMKKTYEAANYVLVLMIRGINISWKQPVAYFFMSGTGGNYDLSDIIPSTIAKLLNISLNVKAFITDQSSNFINFSRSVYVSPKRPYFVVNEKEVVYLFDSSHLLKSTRNMFFKHYFMVGSTYTDHQYLVSFYNEDRKYNVRLAPKLSAVHLNPRPSEKNRVYLAAQVFSQSVSAGMQTYSRLGKLPIESNFTSQFIGNMDRLFDIFNSSKVSNSKCFRCPFKNTNEQKDYLLMMITLFEKLRVVSKVDGFDITTQMSFINGWLISLNGLLRIWNSLVSNYGNDYVLCTNRLNRDCLQKLFDMFRLENGNHCNPTPSQFYIAFRKLFYLNYFRQFPNTNCVKNLDDILCHVDTDKEEMSNVVFPVQTKTKTTFGFKIHTNDYRYLQLPDSNVLYCLCGFLYNKCLMKHHCDLCVDYGWSQERLDKYFLSHYLETFSNIVNTVGRNLRAPNNEFYAFIFELENIFIRQFPLVSVDKGIALNIKQFMTNVPFTHPCPYFDTNYLISLYIRFRIFTSLKFLNKNLFSERRNKNRKLSILKHFGSNNL